MSRGTWIYDPKTGALVDKATHLDRILAERYRAASDLPAPMVIGDAIEVKSMVDGQMYTSKSALRKSYREKGYIEVGNEELKPAPKPKPDRKAIRESVEKAFSRVGISP